MQIAQTGSWWPAPQSILGFDLLTATITSVRTHCRRRFGLLAWPRVVGRLIYAFWAAGWKEAGGSLEQADPRSVGGALVRRWKSQASRIGNYEKAKIEKEKKASGLCRRYARYTD